jgi:hypothetical protein
MATPQSTIEPKAQHYIPKFYLKGFTDKQGALWVYEKFKPMRESTPKKEAHRPDYYTHAEQGERDETAENVLRDTESRVAPIVRKLANRQYLLAPENAAHLIIFVAFMFARVPSWREHLDSIAAQVARETQLKVARDKQRFHDLCAEFESAKGTPLGMDCEELRQYVLKGEFEIVQGSSAFNLGAMFTSALGIAGELRSFGYQALYAPEGTYFETSDSPVYTIQPDGKGQATIGVGFGWSNVEVFFPLNKKTCLRMKRGIQLMGVPVEEERVKQINNLVMATASRYLYSSEGYRRTARLFNERGCKVRPGNESFLKTPPSGQGILFK